MRHATTVTENPSRINHLGSCHIVEIISALSCHTLIEKEAALFLLGEVLESLMVSACHNLGRQRCDRGLGERVVLLIALLSKHFVLLFVGGGGGTFARVCSRRHFLRKHHFR